MRSRLMIVSMVLAISLPTVVLNWSRLADVAPIWAPMLVQVLAVAMGVAVAGAIAAVLDVWLRRRKEAKHA